MPYRSEMEKIAQSGMMVDLLETYLSGKSKERESYRKEPKTYSYGGKIVEQDPVTGKWNEIYNVGTTPDEEPDYKTALLSGIEMYEKSTGAEDDRSLAFRQAITSDPEITKEEYDQYKRHMPTVPIAKQTTAPSWQAKTVHNRYGRSYTASYNPKTNMYKIGEEELTATEMNKRGLSGQKPEKPQIVELHKSMGRDINQAGGERYYFSGPDEDRKRKLWKHAQLASRFYGYLRRDDPEAAMEKYETYLRDKKGFSDDEIGKILSDMAFEFDIEIK